MTPRSAYIGLGANLGQPLQQLRSAVAALATLPESRLAAVSRLYGSAPIGPADQPDYLNTAVRLDTLLTPHALLAALQSIENAHGRERLRHWGERTLDLDLLLYDQDQIHTATLVVPHPEMTRRAFVLLPLSDLDPELIMPDGNTIASYLPGVASQDLHLLAGPDWWKLVD